MKRKLLFIAPFAIFGLLAFVALGGFVVQLLWNGLLPPLFGWPAVTFWQALGLLVLSRILFGGFRVRGGRRPPWRAGRHGRWAGLTPEECEQVRRRMRHEQAQGPGL